MGFTKFEEPVAKSGRRASEPEVYIDPKGSLILNAPLRRAMNPKAPTKGFMVDLYWDGDKRIVGFDPNARGLYYVSATGKCEGLSVLMSRWGGAAWKSAKRWKVLGVTDALPVRFALGLPRPGGPAE